MTGNPFPDGYDGPLSALRNYVENLAVALAIWEARNEPDAHARRCASDAVDAIDSALAGLHKVRQQLISEIRTADDIAMKRSAALLAGLDSSGPAGPEETEGQALERPARERKH
jgi:hypothetical protein